MPHLEEDSGGEEEEGMREPPPAGAAPPAPSPADPATVPYRLQFKFTDGGAFRADFTGAMPLADVFAAVGAGCLGALGRWGGGGGLWLGRLH